jgi:predicted nucleic acid-binding protein
MARVLVDTNVLLRSVQPNHRHHPLAAAAITGLLSQQIDLCVARQNLVEFWAVATRPVANNGLGMDVATAAGEIQKLRAIFTLLEGLPGTADAWQQLARQHAASGKQAHDTHLVATMLVHRVPQLLTFNGNDFKRYRAIKVIEPESVSRTR